MRIKEKEWFKHLATLTPPEPIGENSTHQMRSGQTTHLQYDLFVAVISFISKGQQ
jgi:hypothetical protein